MTVDPNDVLMGGGGAATAKFETPGTTYAGRIVSQPRAFQEREYVKNAPGTGALKFYPKSGDPIMAISVDVQTQLREDADDDGVRRIYVQGKRLKEAIRDAVRLSGANGLEIGGELTVTFTHSENPADPQAAKHYTAQYRPAASAALMNENTAAPVDQAGAAMQVQPYAQNPNPMHNPTAIYGPPATAPAAPASPAAAAPPSGVDPATLQAAMANLSPEVLAAIQAASTNS